MNTADGASRAKQIMSLFEAMPEGLVVQDLSGQITEFNPAALTLTGLTEEVLRGLTRPDGAGGAAFRGLLRPALQVLRTGVTQVNPRLRFTDAEGTMRYVSVTATPICLDGAPKFSHVLSAFRDVTHEQRMLKSRELARTLDTLPSPVAYFDRTQTFVYANELYTKFFGVTPDTIKDRSLYELWGEEYYAQNKPEVELTLAGLERTFERVVTDVDGQSRRAIISYVPDRVDGDVEGAYIYVTDNSLLRKLQNERRGFETRMIASSKMSLLGEMAGGLAHEINNPLAIINGTASVLLGALKGKRLNDEMLETGLVKVEATVQRIARIIRGLRTFARDAGEDPKIVSSLEDVVNETLSLCRERVRARGITLRTNLPSGARLRCNPPQISHVLLNLIRNSVDALDAGPDKWIEVSANVSDGRVRIFVTDGGPVIPPDVAERMMNPFFTTKPVGKGAGLGLSIAKGLAESNGGSLEFLADTKHTCFVLDLPGAALAQDFTAPAPATIPTK